MTGVRDLCDEAGVRIEYVHMADGTKFVFHRNDAFENVVGGTDVGEKSTDKVLEGTDKLDLGTDNSFKSINHSANGSDNVSENGLSANGKRIMRLLEEFGEMKSADVAEILGVSQRAASKALKKLVDIGAVESTGANRNRAYHPNPSWKASS